MKKFFSKLIIALGLVIIGFVISCSSTTEKTPYTGRILYKDSRVIGGYTYTIIEVDGREYLCSRNGGIVELNIRR